MAIKQIKVYFDQNALPYKDKELQVHFPVVGNTFQNGSLTTQIRFYIDNLEMGDSCVWIALCKLPNGQRGYTRLSVYEDSSEDYSHYALLELTNWHTQYNGDLIISLQGYDGNIELVEDDDNNVLIPTGVPVIQATGSIKLTIAYATGVIEGGDVETHTLQELWAYFGEFLRNDSGKYLKVVDSIANINTSTYEDYVHNGDIVLTSNGALYSISGTYPSMTYTQMNIRVNNAYIGNVLYVSTFDHIRISLTNQTLTEYISAVLLDYVTLATAQNITGHKTFTTTITANSGVNFGNNASANMYNGLIKNNVAKLFAIGTDESNRTYYAFPYASVSGSTHGSNNPYVIATQDYAYSKPQADSNFGASLGVSIDPTTYVMTMLLKDKNGDTLSTQSVDLPLESMVVGGTYDEDEKEIVLTLQSGDTITIPVADLISGLVSTTDLATALASYVAKTFTIAGIDMQDNITAQELTDSLVFMNTTTDIDYVMED